MPLGSTAMLVLLPTLNRIFNHKVLINVKNFTLCCYLLFEATDAILINIYLLINCVSLAYLYPFLKCLYMFPAVMVKRLPSYYIPGPLAACSQTDLLSIKYLQIKKNLFLHP